MTTTSGETIRDWLRDAHAMEEQAETLFSGQAERLKDFYGITTKFEAELHYIGEHKILLSARIQQLGSGPSVIKDTTAKIIAGAQNLSGFTVSDEPVKAILALYTHTQMGVASYKILIAAAEATHDEETRRICEMILGHTESRAHWIAQEFEHVTRTYLANVENVAP